VSLIDEIEKQFIAAFKQKEQLRLETLRSLKAALKNKQIELGKKELNEEEVLKVIAAQAKQRKDSIAEFEKAERIDLVQKEKQELEILSSFLPPPLSDKEIEEEVEKTIADLGATGIKDLGKVMNETMKKLAGRVDGGKVSAVVREKLGKL